MKQVRFAVLAMLTHIEQRDFLTVEKPLLELHWGDELAHECSA
jgi:hypothetical protein